MNIDFHLSGIFHHAKISCRTVWMVLLCFILAGCASPSFQDQRVMDLPPSERVTDAGAMERLPMFLSNAADENSFPALTMVLMPGDEIEISFLGAPDLGITQRIRRDGRISLRLVGEMVAGGKTPAQVRAELMDLYGSQIQFKEVTVRILTPPPIFVMGAVSKPGRVDMSRPLSVMDAVAEVGGFDETKAELRSVIVIRNEKGRCRGFALDFSNVLRGRSDQTFYLQPYDVVYVPRTFIVKVDQWVDQYFQKLIPTLGLRYDLNEKMSIYR
jgi:polysaccharide biosynthesis/export protein